jgi:hypothetical protein
MEQLNLFVDTRAPAPVGPLTDAQLRVYEVFLKHPQGLTDYELGYAYRLTHGDLDQSWSGLRTRRKELVDAKVLRRTSEKVNENKRKVGVYALAF